MTASQNEGMKMPEKAGPVWKRAEFIKAWVKCGSASDDWDDFFKQMNAARVAAGCNPYKSQSGLSIQIGKVGKGLAEDGWVVPEYPLRPESKKKKPPTLSEDAKSAGLKRA
jgi:hypothetical protein|tara:strand:+ start:205 stop:537 length:333 start_codon:yes stop_codon:yes gene_type:complete